MPQHPGRLWTAALSSAALLAFTLSGCASAPTAPYLSPVMLFDRSPAPFSAEAFAQRHDARRAPSPVELGEHIYYREFFYDYQDGNHLFHDHYSRRFRTVREGWQRR